MTSSKRRNTSLRLLHFTSKSDKLLIFLGCLAAIISGLSKPLQGLVTSNISNAFIHYTQSIRANATLGYDQLYSEVTYHCFLWFLLATGTFATCFVQTYLLQLAGENLSNRLQKAYLKSLLNQDVSWFDCQKTGSLITEMIRNLDRVKEGTGPHIGYTIHNIVQLIGSFFVCMYFDWKLGQVATCLIPLITIYAKMQQETLAKCERDSQLANREAGEVAEQALSGIRTVMFFNGQEQECDRYQKQLNKIASSGIRLGFLEGSFSAFNNFCIFASCALTVLYGSYCVYDGRVEGGVIVMIFLQLRISLVQMNRLVQFTAKYTKALVAADWLFQVIDKKPVVEISSGNSLFPKLSGNISIKNVNFSYPSRPDVKVLKNFSLSAESGQVVAIVGASGSGKSTVVQLLTRLYDVPKGEILLDNINMRNIDLTHLRNKIGVVSQEPILFNTTIAENIRLGNDKVSENAIWNALKEANAEDFVKRFPLGLRTIVGDRGSQLSGGQKQRIAIVRALVRDPKILLLDEATSALDIESEQIVQEALNKVSKGRTVLVVSHRLSTIQKADKIVVMQRGQVVETGTHQALLQLKGVYFNLVNSQIFKEKETIGTNTRVLSKEEEMTSHATRTEEKKTKKGSIFWRMFEEIGQDKKLFTFCILISVLRGAVQPAGYYVFGELTSIYSGPREDILDKGLKFGLFYLGLAFFQAVVQYIQPGYFTVVGCRVANRLRSKTYRNLMRQDASFYDQETNSAPRILTRLATDVERVQPVINVKIGKLFQEICIDLVGYSMGIYYCWQIALLSIPLFPMAVLCTTWRTSILARKMKENEKEQERCAQLAMEAVSQIKTVKLFNLQRPFHDKFCGLMEGTRQFHKEIIFTQSCSQGILISVHYYLYAFLYLAGLFLIKYASVDAQLFIKSMYLIGWGSGSLATWLNYQPNFLKATVAAEHVFEMMDERPGIDSMSPEGKSPDIKGEIAIKIERFCYPEREYTEVLKEISLTLRPKETVALVGASGCGKSTIVALLERLYAPSKGSIRIDGTDIASINLNHLRSSMSIVSQEPVLFDMSIRENITYGLAKNSVSEEILFQAARNANIHEFILSLPNGYSTRVGDKGTQLSGGQKQRIAIARALVREPKILILDEATSALDTESEKHVQLALDQAKTGRSCLIVAHRLSTVRNAHQIVVMAAGSIVEKGTHDELLQNKGVYYNLVQKQTCSP